MKLEPPVKLSVEKIELDVREIEPLLQGYPMKLPAWPDAMIPLKDGKMLYIRQAREEDVPQMLQYMERVMKIDRDFYDIVGVRVYGEILGWIRKRLKDPFQLVGLIDGEWAGFANGRIATKDLGISLHTMTFVRRGRLGYAMYYAKTLYALEMAGCNEWWSTFESYNGWRMAGLNMAQPCKPYPEVQHELGGARVYYVTREMWDGGLKNFTKEMMGAEMTFDVPQSVKDANKVFRVPTEVNI
jgi:hypothetical protein